MTCNSGLKSLATGVSALCLMAGMAQADQVFVDDVIVQGSLCAGLDCVNGESFGSDTIRLKENNLRIHFQDTSNSASFPTNDWRLVANDSTNGGSNYLAIEDSDAGRQPFRVDAGASANALRIESGGNIGFGTANPAVQLHAVDGNTPTLRLEQDGSNGFTPQTWDIASNEANFFVRDVTNGSSLSFRIRPGAPESSIDIAANGDVGMGTSSPGADLHVRDSDDVQVLIEETGAGFAQLLKLLNNGAPRLVFDNSATGSVGEWHIGLTDPGDDFLIRHHSSSANLMTISTTGTVTLSGLVNCTAGIKTNAAGVLSCL